MWLKQKYSKVSPEILFPPYHRQLLCSVFLTRSTLGLFCDYISSGISADEGTMACSVLSPSHGTLSVCIQDELYVNEFLVYFRVCFRWSEIKREEIRASSCEEN